MFQIAKAVPGDVVQLRTLVNSAYRGEASRKGWTTEADLLDGIRIDEVALQEYFKDKDASILKCVNSNNEIVGCVYLKVERYSLYLGMLTVTPELQGIGIGKMMLDAAEQRAKEGGYRSIVMTVITRRKELIEWYKRHGYKETGEVQPFPGGEKFGRPKVPLEFIVMEKVI